MPAYKKRAFCRVDFRFIDARIILNYAIGSSSNGKQQQQRRSEDHLENFLKNKIASTPFIGLYRILNHLQSLCSTRHLFYFSVYMKKNTSIVQTISKAFISQHKFLKKIEMITLSVVNLHDL